MLFRLILALLAGAVGFVLLFIPGPAFVFFFLAGALLATDWLPIARLLDRGEIAARRLWRRFRRGWSKVSRVARVGWCAAGAGLVVAVLFGFQRLLR